VVNDLKKDSNVDLVVPFAMADNYNGYGVVGTSVDYLKEKPLLSGNLLKG
jgi:hypothetical protein